VPNPIQRQREVRLPGIKLTGNAPRTEVRFGTFGTQASFWFPGENSLLTSNRGVPVETVRSRR
jgi:hypothetical protein